MSALPSGSGVYESPVRKTSIDHKVANTPWVATHCHGPFVHTTYEATEAQAQKWLDDQRRRYPA